MLAPPLADLSWTTAALVALACGLMANLYGDAMRPVLDPVGFLRRIPLQPHELTERATPTRDMIVLCHLGVPRLEVATWRLVVDGLVERELSLSWADLQTLPRTRIESIHQCAGSPLQPELPTRRITNVVWAGVGLKDVLRKAGIKNEATHVWSTGADYGTFDGVTCDAYVKDMPMSRVAHDVLIADELNGAPLPPEHGFPARLVVPGYYGTNSVKWLTRISLAAQRPDGPFTTRWYNDVVRDDHGRPTSGSHPVWAIAPEAVIVSPAPAAVLARDRPVAVRGWAWADGGVASVEISSDDGASWTRARLDAAVGHGWQAFDRDWIPTAAGSAQLMARAVSTRGESQPLAGARNAVHQVRVTVV